MISDSAVFARAKSRSQRDCRSMLFMLGDSGSSWSSEPNRPSWLRLVTVRELTPPDRAQLGRACLLPYTDRAGLLEELVLLNLGAGPEGSGDDSPMDRIPPIVGYRQVVGGRCS